MSRAIHTTTYLLAAALLLPGCADKQRGTAVAVQTPGHGQAYGDPDGKSSSEASDSASQRDAADADTEIFADVALLATCGMEAPTVYFEYDSANVRRAAQVELATLADCLERPPLVDRKLEVIGHADERGTEQYNETLALRRATAVADQLVAQGLDRTRVHTESVGEHGAAMPPEWTDRRVVIRLEDQPE
jgi:outer membrane protein OmpA-like peptidoglycan-associated protein